MHTVAIIGAGFSGSLAAIHLLRRARAATPPVTPEQSLRILLIERRGVFGPGLAYGSGSEKLLLNVVAGRMSALPDDPDHFFRWANKHDPQVKSEMFLPRRLYGRYLADLLNQSAAEAPRSTQLVRLTDDALLIHPSAGTPPIRLHCRLSGEHDADCVILATGNYPSAPPACDAKSLIASGRYIANPWDGADTGLAQVNPTDRVLILGTGLTMMDTVLSLRNAGHRGEIHAVSRRGLLPQPHRDPHPGRAKLPDPLFSRTFSNARELLSVIRAALRHAEAGGGDWRDAINALRSITPSLWQALAEDERRRFLDHLLPFWSTHRHRAPPAVAEPIAALVRSGDLKIHAARITAFECSPPAPSGGGGRVCGGGEAGGGVVRATLQPRGASPEERTTLTADRVINCTGPAMDLRNTDDPLLRHMLTTGLARPGPAGLGLDADPTGALLSTGGAAHHPIYALGCARIGQLWETTAVPELRVQAARLATHVIEHVLHPNHTPQANGSAPDDGKAHSVQRPLRSIASN